MIRSIVEGLQSGDVVDLNQLAFSQDGGETGFAMQSPPLDGAPFYGPPEMTLDPSWLVWSKGRAIATAWSGKKYYDPALTGFGTPTYLWGVANQSREFLSKVDEHGFWNVVTQENGWRILASGASTCLAPVSKAV